MKTVFKNIILLLLFSIAMGYLESAVVIYLRKIYYAEGFHLPLKVIEFDMALVELFREAATLIMLITVALLAGKSRIQRFAFFLICFGIWDIFYYVFLKVFLGWPASLLDGDVLFLIPVPWFGPVLAPCLLSLTMILVAGLMLWAESVHGLQRIGWKNIAWMIAGSCIVIFSFIADYKDYTQLTPSGQALNKDIALTYNWWLFVLGEALILIPAVSLITKKYLRFHANESTFT